MLAPWQYYMKDWEVKVENHLTEISELTDIPEEKIMKLIEWLKEYEIIKD